MSNINISIHDLICPNCQDEDSLVLEFYAPAMSDDYTLSFDPRKMGEPTFHAASWDTCTDITDEDLKNPSLFCLTCGEVYTLTDAKEIYDNMQAITEVTG